MEDPCEENDSLQTNGFLTKRNGKKLRALVVDDDLITRMVVQRLLASIGFEVTDAKNGVDAFNLIKQMNGPEEQSHEAFDVIITDEQMPKMTGLELTKALQIYQISIPIVLMTSELTEPIIAKAFSRGVTEVLAKPLKRSTLQKLYAWLQDCKTNPNDRLQPEGKIIHARNGNFAQNLTSAKPTFMKRALSLDEHIQPPKRYKAMHQVLPAIRQGEKENWDNCPVKPSPQMSLKLLPAKSLPAAYDIRCYSLPPPFITKDFLKSPLSPGPMLQIKPLNIAPLPAASAHDTWKGLKPAQEAQGIEKMAASLSALHHGGSHSAFQSFDRTHSSGLSSPSSLQNAAHLSLPGATSPAKAIQSSLTLPSSFQAAGKQPKGDTSAAYRKEAILRFKAKRQQRSFQKRVRYASRKRLADQRPRVKGQFVKAADLAKNKN